LSYSKHKLINKAFFLGFFLILFSTGFAQLVNRDSLVDVYENKKFSSQDELFLLRELSNITEDPQETLKYTAILIEKAKKLDSLQYLFTAYLQKGNAYRLKSDVSKALEAFTEAKTYAISQQNKMNEAIVNITIGDIYSEIGNYESSVTYYEEGINEIRIAGSDSIQLASALLNYGDASINAGYNEKALSLFFESIAICNDINFEIGTAYNLGNIGIVYAKQKKPKLAEANINEALTILENNEDYYAISVYLDYMSKIYTKSKQPNIALDYAKRSLNLSKKYQLKDEISKAHLTLANIYESAKRLDSSLYHLKAFVLYQDSLSASIKDFSKEMTKLEVSNKQIEVDLLQQKRKNEKILTYSFLGGLVLVTGFSIGLYRRNKYINKTKSIIAEEKHKSDSLLLNILPKETANELKQSGKVEAKKYQSVTVMFTDFKGFTKLAESSAPEKLVESIDMYFSEFDKIIAKYKLEKIKTIGDSYMCAGGLTTIKYDHADLMAQAALDILDFVEKSKQVHAVSEIRFDIRIGMHTGPVVAGVVGHNKFTYDIWGDTVNVASRIESSCEPGKISLSEDTYHLIKDKYKFLERGKIAVKNRSALNMYYLYRK
jgi:class 3 adenylate cyclase